MMAKALEHNGATVYIVGRRLDVLEKAAQEHNVRQPFTFFTLRNLALIINTLYSCPSPFLETYR